MAYKDLYHLKRAIKEDSDARAHLELIDIKKTLNWHGKKYAGTEEQQAIKGRRFIFQRHHKRVLEAMRKIEEAENAPELANPLIITVEWKRSRMWGKNPTATSNYGFNGGSIGGCGYDKLSTATAQALNACLPIMKLLYAAKNEALKTTEETNNNQINRDYLGYGSGYGVIPSFEGGVGVDCHRRICEKLGLKWDHAVSTDNTDVFIISRGGTQ